MSNYKLSGENVTKAFGRRLIFSNISFEYENNGIYGIAGFNGSGKSTLVKVILGLLSPSRGKINHVKASKEILPEKWHERVGFAAPYLILYDEFTASENLQHFAKIRGINLDTDKTDYLLNEFLLFERRNDYVKGYSSGMKQRLKFVFALMHSPELIIFDEPTSNLDSPGKETAYKIIERESLSSIVLLASNEENDLALCQNIIQLENYKNIQNSKLSTGEQVKKDLH